MPFRCHPYSFFKAIRLAGQEDDFGRVKRKSEAGIGLQRLWKSRFLDFFCFILCRLQFFVVTLQTEMKIAKSYIPYGGLFGESRGGEAQRYKYNTARPPGTLSERSGERRNWTACMASTSWTTVPAGWTVPRDVSPPRVLWHMITARGVPTYTAMIIQWTE